nr:hypothetical protein [Actinomycetota bacterium]
ATIVAGVAGGLLGAVVRVLARRARRRREEGERAFSRASDGIWPPVPRADERAVRIAADRAAAPGSPEAGGPERSDGAPGTGSLLAEREEPTG